MIGDTFCNAITAASTLCDSFSGSFDLRVRSRWVAPALVVQSDCVFLASAKWKEAVAAELGLESRMAFFDEQSSFANWTRNCWANCS